MKRDFTQIPNSFIRDNRLTANAFMLMTKIYSLPDDWIYSKEGLKTISGLGRDALNSALALLQDCGYIEIIQYRDPWNGTFTYDWKINKEL